MFFKNNTPNRITLDVGGRSVHFDPGQVQFIPDKYAYVVKARGTPLTPCDDEGQPTHDFQQPPERESLEHFVQRVCRTFGISEQQFREKLEGEMKRAQQHDAETSSEPDQDDDDLPSDDSDENIDEEDQAAANDLKKQLAEQGIKLPG